MMRRIPNKYLIRVRNTLNLKKSRNTLENDVLQCVNDMLLHPSKYIQTFKGKNTWDTYTTPQRSSLREFKPEQEFVASIRIVAKSTVTDEVQFSWSKLGQRLTMCI